MERTLDDFPKAIVDYINSRPRWTQDQMNADYAEAKRIIAAQERHEASKDKVEVVPARREIQGSVSERPSEATHAHRKAVEDDINLQRTLDWGVARVIREREEKRRTKDVLQRSQLPEARSNDPSLGSLFTMLTIVGWLGVLCLYFVNLPLISIFFILISLGGATGNCILHWNRKTTP